MVLAPRSGAAALDEPISNDQAAPRVHCCALRHAARQLHASGASLVIPARVARWVLPTPNTDSPSATANLWAELSGWFSTPFRFQALTEAVYDCAGVRRWPRG